MNSTQAGCSCPYPDVSVAVGPNGTLELVEGQVAWFSPQGGLLAHESLSSFLSSGTDTVVSPQAVYEPGEGAFFVVASDLSRGRVLVGASTEAYWLLPWSFTALSLNGTYLPGGVSVGTASGLVGVSVVALNASSQAPMGSEIWVINESTWLGGGGLRANSYGPLGFLPSLKPAREVAPSDGAFYFAGGMNGSSPLELLRVTGAPPARSVLQNVSFPLAPHSAPLPLTQPGSGSALTAPAPGLESATWSGNRLTAVASVSLSGADVLEVAQVNTSSDSLVYDRVVGSAALGIGFAAVTADRVGDLSFVASASSASVPPSLITFGAPHNEPGNFTAVEVIASGVAAANGSCALSGVCAWGNRSAAAPDPANPLEMWVAGEFVGAPTVDWSTYIALVVYPELAAPVLVSDLPSADVGQWVNFTAIVSGGTGGYHYNWSGALPAGCPPADRATVDCHLVVATTTAVEVAVTDAGGVTTRSMPLNFSVSPALAVRSPLANRTSADDGQSVRWNTSVGGGLPPYFYRWTAPGAAGCASTTAATLDCQLGLSGGFDVSVTVVDANLASASNATHFVAYALPSVALLAASPNPVFAGSPVNISVRVVGGGGVLAYSWSGLPAGCSDANRPTLLCTPSSTGAFVVGVRVTDANGGAANASMNLTVQVAPAGPLSNQLLLTIVGVVVVGAAVSLVAWSWSRRGRYVSEEEGGPAEGGAPELPPPAEPTPELPPPPSS